MTEGTAAATPSYRLHLTALITQAAAGHAAWWWLEDGKLYLAGIYLTTAAGVHLGSFWWFYCHGKQTPGWALWHAGAPLIGLPLLALAVWIEGLLAEVHGDPRPEIAAYALGVLGARGVIEKAKERLQGSG